MARSSVKVTDHGYAALMKRLAAAAPSRLTVGVHEDDGEKAYPSGATVAEVATYSELGLGVPRRSFIADWVDETEAAKRADLRDVGVAVLKGADPNAEFDKLGNRYVGEVVARMASLQPDDPKTEEEKGSSEPLDETGLLRSSIKHRVGANTGGEPKES